MLISKAYAQSVEMSGNVPATLPNAPSATEAFIWNMGLVGLLVAMFYILLIDQFIRNGERLEMMFEDEAGIIILRLSIQPK